MVTLWHVVKDLADASWPDTPSSINGSFLEIKKDRHSAFWDMLFQHNAALLLVCVVLWNMTPVSISVQSVSPVLLCGWSFISLSFFIPSILSFFSLFLGVLSHDWQRAFLVNKTIFHFSSASFSLLLHPSLSSTSPLPSRLPADGQTDAPSDLSRILKYNRFWKACERELEI